MTVLVLSIIIMLDYQKRFSLTNKKNLVGIKALEAVKKNGDVLKYVSEYIFGSKIEELTLEQVCELLGKNIKIVK